MGDMRHVCCHTCRVLGKVTVVDTLSRNSQQDDQYALERGLRGCTEHEIKDDFSNVY